MPRLVITALSPELYVTQGITAFCDALARESERAMGLEEGFNQWQFVIPVATSGNCHDIEIDVVFSGGAVPSVQNADDARAVAAKLEEFCRTTPLLSLGVSYAVWLMGHRLAGYGEGGDSTGGVVIKE